MEFIGLPKSLEGQGLLSRGISSSELTSNNCILFMLETQKRWYRIRLFTSLGWHVGFWNLIGALGFTLSGAFGFAQTKSWAQYQSGCSTFWGSGAFLIGSICHYMEAL